MCGKRQLKSDTNSRPWQDRGNRLAALVGFWIHARALDLAQQRVDAHDAFKQTRGRIFTCVHFHLSEHIQIHTTRKAVRFARGNDDAFHRLVGERVVEMRLQVDETLLVHHVHGFANGVPRDCCDAVGIFDHCKVGHSLSPVWRRFAQEEII